MPTDAVMAPPPTSAPRKPRAEPIFGRPPCPTTTRGQPPPTLEGLQPYGSGREVMLQAFNWESAKQGGWYNTLAAQAEELHQLGVTAVWLPPPTQSLAKEGYMPKDLYNLNSAYGGMQELQACLHAFQQRGVLCIADIVVNHRCADAQDENGVWNTYGGRLAWGAEAVVSNPSEFGGRGHVKKEDMFHAAPNIDHRQAFVREGLANWLHWMREVGYDGWRFDYVRGIWGPAIRQYVEATLPHLVVGEFWDEMQYDGHNYPSRCQKAHRERTANFVRSSGGRSMAFDMTTKGILQAALEFGEYDRLADASMRPPGLLGVWPSRCVLFLENHDTGSTQQHWPFPQAGLEQGHVYMLTHPGTPCLFYDHLQDARLRDLVAHLITIRRRAGITCRSVVRIVEASKGRYVAEVGSRLLMALGPVPYHASHMWQVEAKGHNWCVWERVHT